jgi:hypothetical protein
VLESDPPPDIYLGFQEGFLLLGAINNNGGTMRTKATWLTLILTLAVATGILADLPKTLNYNGKLTSADGNVINDDVDIIFRIFNIESGGAALWSESHSDVPITNGLFSITLGETEGIDIAFDTPYWIELQVDGEILAPREKMASVPYAFRAIKADSVDNAKVQTDGITIIGDGTGSSPLEAVGDNWGTQSVVSDASLGGHGTASSPLSVIMSGGSSGSTDFNMKQQIMFWEAYLKCAGCEALIPNWADTSSNTWVRSAYLNITQSFSLAHGSGSCVMLSDDSYIVVGRYDANYIYAVKFSSSGRLSWTKQIMYSGYTFSGQSFVTKTADGGCIIGSTGTNGSYYYFFFTKLNSDGNLVWSKRIVPFSTYGWSSGIYGMCPTSDGGCVVNNYFQDSGYASHYGLMKIASDGTMSWYSKNGNSIYGPVRNTLDGGYFIIGQSFYIAKYNASGTPVWTKYYPISSQIRDITEDAEGNIYAVGRYTVSNHILFAKLNSSGDFVMARIIDADATFENDDGHGIKVTSGGDIFLTGYSQRGPSGISGSYIIRMGASGSIDNAILLSSASYNLGYGLMEQSSGRLIMTGLSQEWGRGGGYYSLFHSSLLADGETCIGTQFSPSYSSPVYSVTNVTPTPTSSTTYWSWDQSTSITSPGFSIQKVCGP